MFNLSATWTRVTCAAALGLATLGVGCTSGPDPLADNSGHRLTTRDGQQLAEAMFLGKWDLDGERTNNVNGGGGVTAIPTDVIKDVLGKGWRFESGGNLKSDLPVGWRNGSWRIEGKNTLVVNEGKGDQRYAAKFNEGYLYLTKTDGKVLVFERDKFFGT